MESNYISEKELFEKEWPQRCGDSLKVVEKIIRPRGEGKKGNLYLYKIKFVKYPFEKEVYKKHILNGSVVNPEIENKEFIGQIFEQRCGDNLQVLKKSSRKDYWVCQFLKYPCIVEVQKVNLLNGSVVNPAIEEQNFIGSIFQQNCGDSLKVIKKSEQQIQEGKGNYLYEVEFVKYPCKLFVQKIHILEGSVVNPRIEEEEFQNKVWNQNCGDNLKILDKIWIEEENCYYWNVEFINYPHKTRAKKVNIIRGIVDNPNLPWRTKEGLLQAIGTFDCKPTIQDLSLYFNINRSTIGKNIAKFGLREYLQYWVSNEESKIKDFCCEVLNKQIESFNSKDYELDVYLPDFKLGIEYNGNYWHSSIFKKDNYHQEKSLYFNSESISVIHIFEYEWLDKSEIIKSLIKSRLGIYNKVIYARKCEIKQLDYQTYARFCNENHLQGEAGALVRLGLYFGEELIQTMSFSKPRFTNSFEWEIIRECSKLGYKVIGGKQKLWGYFLKNYNPNNCISYCDFSKFDGESYLKLGFKKERLNKPGFVWYDEKTNQIFWRNPYKNQEMKNKGYLKIYDCGQLVFTWFKSF